MHLLLLPQMRSKRATILIIDFRSSWILRSVQWQFLDIVSRQLISPTSRIKKILALENGPINRLETSVRN